MATRTISNAGGNWNSTGTWVEGAVPTSADDVVATATSGNVTITATASCKSADFTNYVGTLTHNSGITWDIYGVLKFVAGMTYTRGSTSTSAIRFQGTTGSHSWDFAGKTISRLQINGAGGTLQLTSALTATSYIEHTAGTFDTNGQTISALFLQSTGSTLRVLTLGASSLTFSQSGSTGWTVSGTNLTVNSGTSTITLTGSTSTFDGGNYTYYNVVLSGAGLVTVTGANSFNNFTRTGTAAKMDGLILSANNTITGTLTLTGNSATDNRLFVKSNTIASARTLTAAVVAITNTDFQDITGAGAASPFTGTSLGNALGNSGITFPASVTRYWVGGHLSWSNNNWAATSGGVAGASMPLCHDDAVFDAGSFSAGGGGIFTVNVPRPCRNITVTNLVSINTDFAGSVGIPNSIFGNVTIDTTLRHWATGQGINLMGRGSHTISTDDFIWESGPIVIEAPGGTYQLLTDLEISYDLQLSSGTFDANDFSLSMSNFTSTGTNTRTLHMGNGTWTVTTAGTVWNVNATGITLNAESSTIEITNTSASGKTFTGGTGLTYNDISSIVAGTGQITLNVTTLRNLTVYGGTRVVSITSATTFTGELYTRSTSGAIVTVRLSFNLTFTGAGTINMQGVSGSLGVLDSAVNGVQRTLSKGTGTVVCDYMSIRDSNATGGAAFYAGIHSTNVSNNAGWIFGDPPVSTRFMATA